MANLKIKRYISAKTCKGNGYVRNRNIYDVELQVHQCWDCDSEGQFEVYDEPG